MLRYLPFIIIAILIHGVFLWPYLPWGMSKQAELGGGAGSSIQIEFEAITVPKDDGLRKAQPRSAALPRSGTDQKRQAHVGAGEQAGAGPKSGAGSSQAGDNKILAEIRRLIERAKHYPLMARRRGIEGTAAVGFRILADGQVTDVRLRQSSGAVILDEAALGTIKKAAPLPAYPEPIHLRIHFALKNKGE